MAATTLLFNAVTAAVADVALNDLSRASDFAHLRAYFMRKSILQAAAYAAATVAIGAALVLLGTRTLLGFAVPRGAGELVWTLGASFLVGCAMDVAIARLRVFRGLEGYYRAHGAGLWGGASLVVCMCISLFMQFHVLPLLCATE